MPGYYDTYLQGLQRMGPAMLAQRRFDEVQRMNLFNQQLRSAQLSRQQQQMMMSLMMQMRNQQRLQEVLGETKRHNSESENIQLKNLIARMQQQMQGSYDIKEDAEGNQWAYDRKRNAMVPLGVMNNQTGQTAPQPGVATTFRQPKALPTAERNKLENLAGNMQTAIGLIKSFKPEYTNSLGETAGDIENAVRQFPLSPMSSEMPNWWRDYQAFARMPARHAISGANLTPREIKEWAKADINPGMRPADVLGALHRRLAILKMASDRAMLGTARNYNRRDVEAATGMSMPKQQMNYFPDTNQMQQIGEELTGLKETPSLESIFGQ